MTDIGEIRYIPNKGTRWEWNALVHHGIEKSASAIFRKNGSNYEAVYGSDPENAGKIISSNSDPTTVIHAMRDNLTSGNLLFKPATITFTSKITMTKEDMNLIGSGWGTVFKHNISGSESLIDFEKRCYVRDILFDNSSLFYSLNFSTFLSSYRYYVDSCAFFNGYGILVGGDTYFIQDNCFISGNKISIAGNPLWARIRDNEIVGGSPAMYFGTGNYFEVKGGWIEKPEGVGISVYGASKHFVFEDILIKDWEPSEGTQQHSLKGIEINGAATNFMINRVRIRWMWQDGITIAGNVSKAQISHCQISNCNYGDGGAPDAYSGITVTNGTGKIDNCRIWDDQGTKVMRRAITLNTSGGWIVIDNDVSDCKTGAVPIRVQDGLDHVLRNNKGFNPVGLITSGTTGKDPFDQTNDRVGYLPESSTGSSSPETSTDYVVSNTDLFVSSTGGTGVSITIKDSAGNTVLSCLTTLSHFFLPIGCKINFGNFSEAPTVTVFGN